MDEISCQTNQPMAHQFEFVLMWRDYTEENSERTSDGFKTVLLLLRFSRNFNKPVPLRENGEKNTKICGDSNASL
jgi:hypothetical protein